jgi:hypothetical protein
LTGTINGRPELAKRNQSDDTKTFPASRVNLPAPINLIDI